VLAVTRELPTLRGDVAGNIHRAPVARKPRADAGAIEAGKDELWRRGDA
jgi:hypothetical protein